MLEDAKPFDRAFIDMMVPHHRHRPALAAESCRDDAPRPGRPSEDLMRPVAAARNDFRHGRLGASTDDSRPIEA